MLKSIKKLLEEKFTVVNYDQRGSGKSYHFFEDYSNLTSDLLVEDLASYDRIYLQNVWEKKR